MKQLTLCIIACLLSFCYGLCLKKACYFDGVTYSTGAIVYLSCLRMQCKDGAWNFLYVVSANCQSCHVWNDPHFYTFDNKWYDWHGRCNYTLSQPLCCYDDVDSYNPPYGIFGSFKECYKYSYVSCLRHTTYKINKHTVLTITHNLFSVAIDINGNSIPVPLSPSVPVDCNNPSNVYSVVLWQYGSCVIIIGRDYSILACPDRITIFTTNSHLYKIGGLCGYFTGEWNTQDDFLMRSCGPVNNNINSFAVSWKTNTYCRDCYDFYKKSYQFELDQYYGQYNEIKECASDDSRAQCEEVVNKGRNCGKIRDEDVIKAIIEGCVNDYCNEPDVRDRWMATAYNLTCDIGIIGDMQARDDGGNYTFAQIPESKAIANGK